MGIAKIINRARHARLLRTIFNLQRVVQLAELYGMFQAVRSTPRLPGKTVRLAELVIKEAEIVATVWEHPDRKLIC